MAELREGTTIGGRLVWTQGNFPLVPNGNSLSYNNFLVYTKNDKPNADDNDFVSKARGGTYGALVNFNLGVAITAPNNRTGSIVPGNADGATRDNCSIDIQSNNGIGFRAPGQVRNIWINVRSGEISTIGTINASLVNGSNAPTANTHLTNKAYVDNRVNFVQNSANTKVDKAGDTMTGNLTAQLFVSNNRATSNNHVPRLDQVVQKGTTLDYGEY